MPPKKTKIQRGDTLSGIARREKTTIPELLRLNPNIKNPDLIYAGSSLNLPGQTPIAGTPTSSQLGTPAGSAGGPTQTTGSPIASAVQERGQQKSGRDTLIDRLTSAISGVEAFNPAERQKELEQERGVGSLRDTVGNFDEEIAKSFDLLDNLESDLKQRTGEFLITDPQRRRVLASEQNPIIEDIGRLERGQSTAQNRLSREEDAIANLLGLEQDQAQKPLDLLSSELGLRSDINTLTGAEGEDDIFKIASTLSDAGATQDQVDDIFDSSSREEALAKAAATGLLGDTEEGGFTLSPGQTRYDAQGNIIASGGERPLSDKEIERKIEKTEKDEASRTAQVNTVSIINDILSGGIDRISGNSVERFFSGAGFTGTAGTRGKVAQLKALTALGERDKLKGSGTISDFEAGMLSDSAAAINFAIQDDGQIAMSDESVVQNLKNIRGVLKLRVEGSATVVATDPATGESRVFLDQSREDIEDASLKGYLIDFE